MTDERRDDDESRDDEAERYRVAAEEALIQLDWCVTYLHGIRKRRIADAIARNRTEIRRRLRA